MHENVPVMHESVLVVTYVLLLVQHRKNFELVHIVSVFVFPLVAPFRNRQ